MKVLEEIMSKRPIISQEEFREVERLALAMGQGECCAIETDEDFSTVLSVILLAGMEALSDDRT